MKRTPTLTGVGFINWLDCRCSDDQDFFILAVRGVGWVGPLGNMGQHHESRAARVFGITALAAARRRYGGEPNHRASIADCRIRNLTTEVCRARHGGMSKRCADPGVGTSELLGGDCGICADYFLEFWGF